MLVQSYHIGKLTLTPSAVRVILILSHVEPVMFRRMGQMPFQIFDSGKPTFTPTAVRVVIVIVSQEPTVVILSLEPVMFRRIGQMLVQSIDGGKLTFTNTAVGVIVVLVSQESVGYNGTIIRLINDENERLHFLQINELGICLVALACDLRRKKLVNVLPEHERQKCSTGIVSI